ncbi:MAG: GNAT family N-acetyltransferase [Chloroflexota bacterium]
MKPEYRFDYSKARPNRFAHRTKDRVIVILDDALFLEKVNMIQLLPMTQPEFDAFLESSIPEYAADKVRAGNWTQAESLERSRKGYADLLPQGLATPNNYLFSVKDSQSDERLGWFWLAVEKDNAFIYDIVINEEHRRKGYGTQVMHAAEVEARHLRCNKIGLHVFGFNKEAFALYQKLGYEVTNINMSKAI